MESLTRLVTESLARHGFDRPLDYRRLRWSRWFRCESHHSLLLVPSKPGVFALAEEIMDLAHATNHVAADAPVLRAGQSSAGSVWDRVSDPVRPSEARLDLLANLAGSADVSRVSVEERRFSAASSTSKPAALAAEEDFAGETAPRRMLAVTHFFEADDMAFVLDRMLARQNPLRASLNSGRYFIRFVIIEDGPQRRSVCNALNQWVSDQAIGNQPLANSAESFTSIASHFARSLELTPATEYVPAAQASLFENASVGRTLPSTSSGQALSATAGTGKNPNAPGEATNPAPITAHHLDSGAATNIHCPSPLPSGF